MGESEDYPDPFEKMARDLKRAGETLIKETKKQGRPECPDCGEKLWKRRDGDFSCPNPSCDRDAVTAEEIASRKIAGKFSSVF